MAAVTIRLTPDGNWAVYAADTGDDDAVPLVVGAPFEPGAVIREAVGALEAWAADNGYTVTEPHFSGADIALETLIEPELYDEVFGPDDR